MEIGEVYTAIQGTMSWIARVVGQYTGNNISDGCLRCQADFIRLDNQSHYFNRGFCLEGNGRTYREATPEEIKWLDFCLSKKKFIPLEEARKQFTIHYSIY